jgi:hypothetical protein
MSTQLTLFQLTVENLQYPVSGTLGSGSDPYVHGSCVRVSPYWDGYQGFRGPRPLSAAAAYTSATATASPAGIADAALFLVEV